MPDHFYRLSDAAGGNMGKRIYLIYALSDLINKGETENSDTLIAKLDTFDE